MQDKLVVVMRMTIHSSRNNSRSRAMVTTTVDIHQARDCPYYQIVNTKEPGEPNTP